MQGFYFFAVCIVATMWTSSKIPSIENYAFVKTYTDYWPLCIFGKKSATNSNFETASAGKPSSKDTS